MRQIFTITRIKLILIVIFTVLVVKAVAPKLFLADSPKINPFFIANTLNSSKKLIASIGKLNLNKKDQTVDTKKNQSSPFQYVTPPPNLVFEFISKGVSAAEDPTTGQKFIKVEAGTKYKIVGEITLNGKKYPKIEFVE